MLIEMLAIEIRSNPKIEGIRYKDFEALLSMFADDINIFIANKPRVWTELQSIIRHLEESSGLKINDKSTVYRLGSARKSKAMHYTLKKLQWLNGPVRVLGILIDEDQERMQSMNLEPVLQKQKIY